MRQKFWERLVRKKILLESDVQESDLNRCLTTFDLVSLGIGSTLGAGLYVVTGQVALENAGPSVTVSFLVAAVASALAGMCYAEFAARIPRAGSAYVYSYVTVGEFMAFIIGWNLVLEYVIGTASVARGWSAYFDSLIDKKISRYFNSTMPMHISQLSAYPDFFAFSITLLLTALLTVGVKESARFNNVFTCINLLVVLYVTICGLFKLDFHNWNLSKDEVPSGAGSGGFMPHGFSGTMAGAATCFYAFIGFDCVASTGEETKNPQRSIPVGIVVSLLLIFLSYFSVASVITLMCPYYLLDKDAALPAVFDRIGWGVARYIITVGAVCGLSTSLLGAMFPLPRILYAMGNDGVIFRFLGKVSKRFKTPIVGTVVSGLFAGLMTLLFDIKELVDMMSIGTLLAYTLVCVSVLLLRYEADVNLHGSMRVTKVDEAACVATRREPFTFLFLIHPKDSQPSQLTSSIVKVLVVLLCLFLASFSFILIFADTFIADKQAWAVTMATVVGLICLTCVFLIYLQPQNNVPLPFKVPLVPILPAVSVFVNVYLMLKLSAMTWARFSIWMAFGTVIYFGYGIGNSTEEQRARRQDQECEITLKSMPDEFINHDSAASVSAHKPDRCSGDKIKV